MYNFRLQTKKEKIKCSHTNAISQCVSISIEKQFRNNKIAVVLGRRDITLFFSNYLFAIYIHCTHKREYADF